MKLLDRYVLRTFLRAYAYCIAAFVSIWLIFDISDNLSTFLDDRVSLLLVTRYYLTQLPQIFVILLPVSLLLALLFSLGRMSRRNEIVSMLTAGVSIPRLILPLVAMGFFTALVSGVLNYSLAPKAELTRRTFFEDARNRGREPGLISGQIFRNRAEARTWFIQHFRPERNEYITVQVLQQDEHENVKKNYMATRAYYHPDKHAWELQLVKVVTYDAGGNIVDDVTTESLMMTQWSETPFRLTSSTMRAEHLSLGELHNYLNFNADFPPSLLAPFSTHFQYRIALPWTCVIVVFLAAPLAIVFSRRGILSSVAAAIGLVFAMNFLTHLFLALGEGARIPPWAAAWGPNIVFASVGFLLLYIRSTNRDARSLNPFAWRRAAIG
ncbi:MAG TPA: LptF/LptG family permease [Chthoniobacterales bacterium]|nr:LptF/LptG family permease [Chthoniobacterales bacterium]